MAINKVETIDDRVRVKTVLASVSDKTGLDLLVRGLLAVNPDMRILSTGGTFSALAAMLGASSARSLRQVSDYTGQPEMQGGLVKTLDFKIYLGLLSETYNHAHQQDLKRTGAAPIDMVVVNLYPFRETVARPGATLEDARGTSTSAGPAWCVPRRRTSTGSPCSLTPPIMRRWSPSFQRTGRWVLRHASPLRARLSG